MTAETVVVALATAGPVVGSAIGVWKRPSTAVMANILYAAAGIMAAIAFLDLIPESLRLGSVWTSAAGLTVGASLMLLRDRLFPHVHDCSACGADECRLGRTARFLVLAIFLHNFPEGMAMAVGAAAGLGDSLAVALAIAVHNVPEGICTAAPYFYASGRRGRSFWISSASALPIVLGYGVMRYGLAGLSLPAMSALTGATAGLMIYIAAAQLMPAARETRRGRQALLYLLAGILAVIVLDFMV